MRRLPASRARRRACAALRPSGRNGFGLGRLLFLFGLLFLLPLEDLLEALDRVLELDVHARLRGERLRDVHRLREEALDLARARDDELVLVRELVDAEDRDDVLQILVALQDLLDARGGLVVLVRDDPRLE